MLFVGFLLLLLFVCLFVCSIPINRARFASSLRVPFEGKLVVCLVCLDPLSAGLSFFFFFFWTMAQPVHKRK